MALAGLEDFSLFSCSHGDGCGVSGADWGRCCKAACCRGEDAAGAAPAPPAAPAGGAGGNAARGGKREKRNLVGKPLRLAAPKPFPQKVEKAGP